ncbi:hypothetical protein P153DRAFT_404397 [Dothidotthia symphoricarpi CBS 119687]|uniref:Uncharacterized protein n=1 Tax=Dothidotthia symphoricarpi CBS 119687 TaxID=1392245 RepID=A0A6A6A9V1_9PLEO|nr:uncharacterized protein P153DRAFT_404397 [Dothidotthia symphoricarpi CBS 119687]KAF2128346.1 hypothetical protein P153DRAFT_404397 [Dothidotthia symphoricarpi CBS 119687]
MPPKKAAANGDTSEAGGKFTWEGPNDSKLLLLIQGRYVKPEEYETLSTAFPGTTAGSIRNRISALRVKQRTLYDDLKWELPEGGAGHSAKKKKRELSGAEEGTPTKKARVKKGKGSDGEGGTPAKKSGGVKRGKKVQEEVKMSDGDEEMELEMQFDMDGAVKREVDDEGEEV